MEEEKIRAEAERIFEGQFQKIREDKVEVFQKKLLKYSEKTRKKLDITPAEHALDVKLLSDYVGDVYASYILTLASIKFGGDAK